MKNLIPVILVFFSSILYGQNNTKIPYFADLFYIKCEATVLRNEAIVSDDGNLFWEITAQLPSSYNYDLTKKKLSNLVNEYSNVSFDTPWSYDHESGCYETFLIIVDHSTMAIFSSDDNCFTFFWDDALK
jgi:hypothetical protein